MAPCLGCGRHIPHCAGTHKHLRAPLAPGPRPALRRTPHAACPPACIGQVPALLIEASGVRLRASSHSWLTVHGWDVLASAGGVRVAVGACCGSVSGGCMHAYVVCNHVCSGGPDTVSIHRMQWGRRRIHKLGSLPAPQRLLRPLRAGAACPQGAQARWVVTFRCGARRTSRPVAGMMRSARICNLAGEPSPST